MTDLVPADQIEQIVGAHRHPTAHIARAITAEQTVYILHPTQCRNTGIDLRECEYSTALDQGIALAEWEGRLDLAEEVRVSATGQLVPAHLTGREIIEQLQEIAGVEFLAWQIEWFALCWDTHRFAAVQRL